VLLYDAGRNMEVCIRDTQLAWKTRGEPCWHGVGQNPLATWRQESNGAWVCHHTNGFFAPTAPNVWTEFQNGRPYVSFSLVSTKAIPEYDWKFDGVVALRNCYGCLLSWGHGDCRANERHINNQEKWRIDTKSDGNRIFCRFSRPLGNGLFSWMSVAGDGTVNSNAQHPSTEWEILPLPLERKCAFRTNNRYLSNEPPGHSRSRQVVADRTSIGESEKFSMESSEGWNASFWDGFFFSRTDQNCDFSNLES